MTVLPSSLNHGGNVFVEFLFFPNNTNSTATFKTESFYFSFFFFFLSFSFSFGLGLQPLKQRTVHTQKNLRVSVMFPAIKKECFHIKNHLFECYSFRYKHSMPAKCRNAWSLYQTTAKYGKRRDTTTYMQLSDIASCPTTTLLHCDSLATIVAMVVWGWFAW